MRTRLAVGLVVATLGLGMVAAPAGQAAVPPSAVTLAGSATSAEDHALASRLVNHFFTLLKNKDHAALVTFLSPAFQLERPDGTGVNKHQYLLSPAVVDAFTITGLTASRAGDVLVARYMVEATQTVNGQAFAKDPAPRLSVFKKNTQSGKWQLVAHANFNGIPKPA